MATIKDIVTKEDLDAFYETLPEGSTANRNTHDLDTGNFEQAHFELPDGSIIDIVYSGPSTAEEETEA